MNGPRVYAVDWAQWFKVSRQLLIDEVAYLSYLRFAKGLVLRNAYEQGWKQVGRNVGLMVDEWSNDAFIRNQVVLVFYIRATPAYWRMRPQVARKPSIHTRRAHRRKKR